MPSDQPPIPHEALPPGWGPADVCEEFLAYRHRRPPIELVAERTDADRVHPVIGLERCWELRYRFPIGELSIDETLGRVSTKRAALDGLLESMHRIHDCVEDFEDSIEVRRALDGLSLGDRVPDGFSCSSP